MDERIDMLETMLAKMTTLLAETDTDDEPGPTPCPTMTVEDLAEHLAVWMQVFAGAVNETGVDFDPMTHRVGPDRATVFAQAAARTVSGLRSAGYDRPMIMTADPVPGELILNMLLMEYVGHGWDLARSTGRPVPHSEAEAEAALAAARAIVQPEYRGPELFEAEVTVADDASAIDRLVAFLGRDPNWVAPAGLSCG